MYAAELAAFDGTDLEALRTLEEIRDLVAAVVEGPWWPGPSVVVRPARSDAGSSSARSRSSGDDVIVRIAATQATHATAAHELAHALAGPDAGHDARFRCAYLDVVLVMTNLEPGRRRGLLHQRQLSEAFAAHGLDVGERTWPAADDAAGPISL